MRVKRQMRINSDPLSLSVFLSSSEEENDVMRVKRQMRFNNDPLRLSETDKNNTLVHAMLSHL